MEFVRIAVREKSVCVCVCVCWLASAMVCCPSLFYCRFVVGDDFVATTAFCETSYLCSCFLMEETQVFKLGFTSLIDSLFWSSWKIPAKVPSATLPFQRAGTPMSSGSHLHAQRKKGSFGVVGHAISRKSNEETTTARTCQNTVALNKIAQNVVSNVHSKKKERQERLLLKNSKHR